MNNTRGVGPLKKEKKREKKRSQKHICVKMQTQSKRYLSLSCFWLLTGSTSCSYFLESRTFYFVWLYIWSENVMSPRTVNIEHWSSYRRRWQGTNTASRWSLVLCSSIYRDKRQINLYWTTLDIVNIIQVLLMLLLRMIRHESQFRTGGYTGLTNGMKYFGTG